MELVNVGKAVDTTIPLVYTCPDSSIQIRDKFYSKVQCADNQWTGDGAPIDLDDKYKLSASCHGSFKYVDHNCETVGKDGCAIPILKGDTITCPDGYVLNFDNEIFGSLRVVKGKWVLGSDRSKDAGNEKPMCYSKCMRKNIDVSYPKEMKWGREASYKWEQSDNTGELKCDEATDILYANFEVSDKSYPDNWKCDAKTEWSSGQSKRSLTGPFTDPAQLKFNAYCFKACTGKRVKTTCDSKKDDCKEAFYLNDVLLKCPSGEILFINDFDEFSEPLTCSNKGWADSNNAIALTNYDHANKDVGLSAQCFDRCSTKFRGGDVKEKLEYTGVNMKCTGTHMISYTVKSSPPAKTTLKDLYCDGRDGWKEENNNGKILIKFGIDGYKFKAECVPSCTENHIEEKCNGIKHCEKPQILNDLITCKDDTKILESKGNYEYKDITCTKASFKNDDGLIEWPRTKSDMKIEVKCISKCDKKFVKLQIDATSQLTPQGTDTDNIYNIHCDSTGANYPVVYTKLTTKDKGDFYTATKFECDPATGWSATDIATGLVADFAKKEHFTEAEATCFDVCIDRFVAKCPIAEEHCAKPTYANGEISCGNSHTMSIKNEEMIDEKLTCRKSGYARKSNVVVFKFDNVKPTEQFDMHCFSNCYEKLVTWMGVPGANDHEKMNCHSDDELLVVTPSKTPGDAVRVFGEAKCEAAVGWKGEVAKSLSETANKKLIDFKKDVRLTAACHKVCDDNMVTLNACDAEDPKCKQAIYASKTLKCGDNNHRLFIKHEAMTEITETGDVKCSRLGWKDPLDTKAFINFLDPNVDFTEKVGALCKHKCHPDFVQPSTTCDQASKDAGKCSDAKYVNNDVTCEGEYDIVVLEYKDSDGNLKPSESFGPASCTNDGWMSGTRHMFNPANDKYHIEAKCVNVCHPSTLTDLNNESREYKLGEKLTCTDAKKMLVFNANKWYTDLKCSKKGWISTDTNIHPEADLKFQPDVPREFNAECLESQCVRDYAIDPCMDGSKELQGCRPDWKTEKYVMECKLPAKIVRSNSGVTQDKLYCKNDAWYNGPNFATATVIVPTNEPFDVACKYANCVTCTNKLNIIDCGSDTSGNCKKLGPFISGTGYGCSRYDCGDYHYKIGSNGLFKYYTAYKDKYSPQRTIRCHGSEVFHTPDDFNQIAAGESIGCVEWIPCNEHSPINTECTSLTDCDSEGLNKKLIDGSSKHRKAITCDDNKHLFHKNIDGKKPWKQIEKLKCNDKGEWDVIVMKPGQDGEPETETTEKEALPKNARVVCAKENPYKDIPPPTTTPKPGVCESCALPPVLKCEGCDKDRSKTKTETDGDTCKMTSTTSRFAFNDGTETLDPLICKETKNETSVIFIWKTNDGKIVNQVASITRTIDQVNKGLIGGIVAGVLLLLISIGAFIAFIVVRKKREAQRLETLKSKGLEQKNDTIIDSMTIIEDPKTIRL